MEIRSFEPKTVKSNWLPYQEARVMTLADIQWGATEDRVRLEKYVKWADEKDCYILGAGDYVDVASPSNRKLIGQVRASLYDSFRRMMDERVEQYVEELYDTLKPTRGRWLGLLTGHHTWEFDDGTTTESRLAAKLKAPLLGHCAAIIMKFRNPNGHASPQAVIWAHHGAGGGLTEGAAFNRLGHVSKTFIANVYVMAHTHQKGVMAKSRIRFVAGSKHAKSIGETYYYVLAGGFLKAYEQGSVDARGRPGGGYVEQKMLNPVALGAPVIMFRPAFDGETDRARVDINVDV